MHSSKNRFLFSILINGCRAIISFITGMALARFMEPANFGSLSFLLGTFLGLGKLLDMGTSQAFFTFLSQKQQSRRFINVYLLWLLTELVLTLLIIGVLFPDQWINFFWRGEHRLIILLAFVASFMQNTVWLTIQRILESQRHTYFSQSVGIAIVVVHIICVVLFWFFGILGLTLVLLAMIIEYSFAIVYVGRNIYKGGDQAQEHFTISEMLTKYCRYISPLIVYSIFGFLFEFSDKWLLQSYGGRVQQAYYSVSNQIASIALLATSSIINVLWKEMAEAHHRENTEQVHYLYRRSTKVLLFVGAVVAGFLIPWAGLIIHVFLGEKYAAGASTLAIMFLYPIHQAIGQINGTLLYATEKTRVQVLIGILFMIGSIITSYFLLAPSSARIPGLGLASEGLAIKMVVMQFIQVISTCWYIAVVFRWKYEWVSQFSTIGLCLLAGWLAYHTGIYITSSMSWAFSVTVGGFCYLLFIFGFSWLMPGLMGFSKVEVQKLKRQATVRIQSIFIK